MDRQEKLHLSNDEAWGCCFVQGVFVRFFERSLYHFNRTARPLKPMLERVKGGGKIVYGGMPIQVFERLVAQGTPRQAEKMEYGWRWPHAAQPAPPDDTEAAPDFETWRNEIVAAAQKPECGKQAEGQASVLEELTGFNLAAHTPMQAMNAIASWQEALRK